MTKENMNTGNMNTGNRNTGNWNTGNRNTGNRNTGNWNTGNWNTGNWNTGYMNTGNWNTGNWNTGYMNTKTPKVIMFNKLTDKDYGDIVFPDFFYYTLAEWVYEADMRDKEKKAHPSYVTTGGYLKSYNDKTAWRNSWDKADEEDRRKVLELPNFDNDIFKEISGIDAEKELNEEEEIVIDGKKYSEQTIKRALQEYVN